MIASRFVRALRLAGLGLGACVLASAASLAGAQPAYPNAPVRLVVPFAPGGAVDMFARMLAPLMSADLGQPILVDNRAGAGGNLGAAHVAQSPPNGYTALLVYDTYAVAPLLYRSLPYDPAALMPVSLLAKIPLVMLMGPQSTVTDMATFQAQARARPGGMNFSSGGAGSSGHLTAELVKRTLDLKMTHVPYKGGAPALNAVLSQEVDLTFLGTLATAQFVQGGRARAIAIMGSQPVSVMPGVPTISSLGHPELEVYSWYGVLLPAGTPAPVVERLRGAMVKAMADPEIKRRLLEQGGVIVGSTPPEFGRFLQSETARWDKVVRAANIRVDE
jgi:tripartite-type tricarboxylate transporter receptor subunit TctC